MPGIRGHDSGTCCLPRIGWFRWDDADKALAGLIAQARERVHAALLDNLDCPKVLQPAHGAGLTEVRVGAAGTDRSHHQVQQLHGQRQDPQGTRLPPHPVPLSALRHQGLLLRKAAEYVTKMLAVFGIVESPAADGVGFAEDAPVEEAAQLIDRLSALRSQVPAATAMTHPPPAAPLSGQRQA